MRRLGRTENGSWHSFLGRLVDVDKATAKSSIKNIEIVSCLLDIDLNAIALLANKAVAALFGSSSVSFRVHSGMHEIQTVNCLMKTRKGQ